MKVRFRQPVAGTFHGREVVEGLHSVQRGEILDLDERDVLRYLKNELVELKLEGEFGRGEKPNAGDIAKLEKQLRAEEARRPKQALKTVTFDGATYLRVND